MKIACLLLVSLLTCLLLVNSSTSNPIHRTKRELYKDFVDKHVIFVKAGKKPTYELFRGRLPAFANTPNRKKHSFIVVIVNNSGKNSWKKEDEAKRSFLEKLDSLITEKISNGGCKAKRDKNRPEVRQESLRVKPNTCKNPAQTKILIDDYFICPIQLKELESKIYLAEFNVQDKNDACVFSEEGSFSVGAGIKKNVDSQTRRKTKDWFLVNHLETSEVVNGIECVEK